MSTLRANSIWSVVLCCTVVIYNSLVFSELSFAQSADTARIASSDTLKDTLGDTLSSRRGPVVPDTLVELLFDRAQRSSDTSSRQLYKPLDFNQLAAQRLLSASANLRKQIDNGSYHDAGDFFSSERGFFTVDYLPTPMRHTVSPYGLNSVRVSPILDGRTIAPLEHLPEQDGLLDFNEVPTAPVTAVTPLHGPVAAFMGAENGVAGVYLDKVRPRGFAPESRLEAQKGTFSYAHTKGVITETTPSGFAYLAALGYRKVNYVALANGRDDDMYHQYWEFSAPLAPTFQASSIVRLYRRQGEYTYQPQLVGSVFDRHRRDRDIAVSLQKTTSPDRTFALDFRHQRNESALTARNFSYDFKFDKRLNSISFSHTARSGDVLYTATATAARSYFDVEDLSYQRDEQSASLRALVASRADSAVSSRLFFGEFGFKTITKYKSIPRASLGFRVQNEISDLTVSAGITPVFPSQYQRFLPDEILFNGLGSSDLRQAGNPSLGSEKQYTTSIVASHRLSTLALNASAVAGKITDGILWRRSPYNLVGAFIQPQNEDYKFAALSLRAELPLSASLLWSGAAGFYTVDYENTPAPTYTPQYNMQTALTLNHYIRQLELYLSGHAELALPGPYLAYSGAQLGRNPVVNARLSFRIKNFNFHYMFEDMNSINYAQREQFQHLGRYNWYWITWDFLD